MRLQGCWRERLSYSLKGNPADSPAAAARHSRQQPRTRTGARPSRPAAAPSAGRRRPPTRAKGRRQSSRAHSPVTAELRPFVMQRAAQADRWCSARSAHGRTVRGRDSRGWRTGLGRTERGRDSRGWRTGLGRTERVHVSRGWWTGPGRAGRVERSRWPLQGRWPAGPRGCYRWSTAEYGTGPARPAAGTPCASLTSTAVQAANQEVSVGVRVRARARAWRVAEG